MIATARPGLTPTQQAAFDAAEDLAASGISPNSVSLARKLGISQFGAWRTIQKLKERRAWPWGGMTSRAGVSDERAARRIAIVLKQRAEMTAERPGWRPKTLAEKTDRYRLEWERIFPQASDWGLHPEIGDYHAFALEDMNDHREGRAD